MAVCLGVGTCFMPWARENRSVVIPKAPYLSVSSRRWFDCQSILKHWERDALSRTGRERKGKRRLWTWAGSGGESMFGTPSPRQSKKQVEDNVVSCPRNPREPRDFILRSFFAVCQGTQRRAESIIIHEYCMTLARGKRQAFSFENVIKTMCTIVIAHLRRE